MITEAPTSLVPGAPVADAPFVSQPWKKSWFYCSPGESATLIWVITIHVLTIAGLILLPLPSWPVLVLGGILFWLGGLGTTVAYHRALAHRSLSVHPLIENVLIFFAMFNGSGNPLTWIANHRHHHAHSDTELDVSSPAHGGFWWAHLRWLWQSGSPPVAKYCRDLEAPRYAAWTQLQTPVLALSLLGGLCYPGGSWLAILTAALWLGPLRLLVALHIQCSVNSLCHLGPVTGPHGSGRNVWWMTLFHVGQGENWHANHHRFPGSARLGNGLAQLDVGWWVIKGLSWCRLASRIKAPRKTEI